MSRMYSRSRFSALMSADNASVGQSSNNKWTSNSPLPRKLSKPGSVVFTISASPKCANISDNDENESPELVLQHFNNQTIVDFRKVYVGESKTMSLKVRNPNDVDLVLSCATSFNPKKGFGTDFICDTVPGNNGSITILITWSPKEVGCQRELVYFDTNARHKLRVTLIGTSVTKEKKQRKIKCVSTTKRPFRQIQANQENIGVSMRSKHPRVDKVAFADESLTDCSMSDDFIRRETFLIRNNKRFSSDEPGYKFEADLEPETALVRTFNKYTQVCMHALDCHCNYAACKIQSWYRGVKTRERLQKEKEAACKIQRWFRIKTAQKRFRMKLTELKMEAAVTRIQSCYRMVKARQQFRMAKKAAMQIQRWYVQKKVQQRFRAVLEELKKDAAATKIQKWYRRVKANELFQKQTEAAVVLQNFYRNRVKVHILERERVSAAVRIQSWFRGVKIRERLQKKKEAASKIQRWYRTKDAQKRFRMKLTELKREAAVTRIQSWYRMVKARQQFRVTRKAAMQIQRWYAQKKVQQRFRNKLAELKREDAATRIQNWYRRVKAHELLKKQTEAAVVLQNFYRNRVKVHIAKRERVLAAVRIQSWFRGVKTRERLQKAKENEAACKIQGWFRIKTALKRFRAKLEELKKDAAATKIQRWYRRVKADELFQKQTVAAVVLQSFYRNLVKLHIAKRERVSAACRIQSWYRGVKTRERLLKEKEAACKIQAWFRTKTAQKQFRLKLTELKKDAAATKIQSWYRMVKVRQRFRMTKKAVIQIQRWYAQKKVQQRFRNKLAELKKDAAATQIQSWYRMVKVREQFRMNKKAAMQIQRWYAQKKVQQRFRNKLAELKREEAVTRIQSWYRGAKVRQHLAMEKESVTVIQRYFRQWKMCKEAKESLELLKRDSTAVKIQSWYRMVKARRNFLLTKEAAINIQRWYKQIKMRKRIELEILNVKKCDAASKIQRWYRRIKADALLRKQLEAVVVLQKFYRNLVKLHIAKRKRVSAACKIQSWFRGVKTRRVVFVEDERLHSVFQSLQEATARVSDANRLGNRTAVALEKLLSYKSLNPLSQHLCSLAYTTSMSKNCCIRMVEVPDAVKILTKVIRETNRSEPHKVIVEYSWAILLNLAKFEDTANVILHNKSLPQLILTHIKIHQREGKILTKLLTLLWIILSVNQSIITKENYQLFSNMKTAIRMEYQRKKLTLRKPNIQITFSPSWHVGQGPHEFIDRYVAVASICEYFRLKL